MKLFMIYIGGIHEKSLIELHDIRFVVANNIEDTYEELKSSWWGTSKSLHIDAWGAVDYADGYNITLKPEAPLDSDNKLYFVNLGGYDNNEFTELHKNILVVASNPSKAKVRALKQILDWQSHHRDYQFELESILSVSQLISTKNLHIHLEPSDTNKKFEFTCKYLSIGEN